MFNYNKISFQLKDFIANFTNNMIITLPKPISKALTALIYGIIKSNSCMLSNIARSLKETIKIKDSVDRLTKNLDKIFLFRAVIYNNYYNHIKPYITDETLFHVDDSDINKNKSKALENLDWVKDGSDEDGKLVKGYWVNEIVATNGNNVFSVYSKIYSTLTKGFKSANNETYKGIAEVIKAFGKIGTYVMDRGYDSRAFLLYFLKKGIKFIIRGKKNRDVIYNDKKINILELANKFKGKFRITLIIKGKKLTRYASCVKVKLPNSKYRIYAVFVYFKGETVIFYTNQEIECKKDIIRVVTSYYSRWKIEEYFKFKKQQFGFENFRVRSLSKMNGLNLILSLAIGCITLINQNTASLKAAIIYHAGVIKEKVFFEYYRLGSGIREILSHTVVGIRNKVVFQCNKYVQLSIFGNFAET